MKDQISNILTQLGMPVKRTTSSNVFVSCPLADSNTKFRHNGGKDTLPSMSVMVDEPFSCHCFGCGYSAKSITTLASLLGRLRGQDYSHIVAEVGIPSFDLTKPKEEICKKFNALSYEQKMRWWTKTYHPYLEKRGIDRDTALVWELGFDPIKQCITIPVRDRAFNLCGVQGRGVTGKTFHNYYFQKAKYLLGEHFSVTKTAILVEGPFDLLSLWQWLRNNNLLDEYSVVSTLGVVDKNATEQVDRIVTSCERLVLFYDHDAAGYKAKKAVKELVGNRLLVEDVNLNILDKKKYYQNGQLKIDPDRIVKLEPEKLKTILNNTVLFS